MQCNVLAIYQPVIEVTLKEYIYLVSLRYKVGSMAMAIRKGKYLFLVCIDLMFRRYPIRITL